MRATRLAKAKTPEHVPDILYLRGILEPLSWDVAAIDTRLQILGRLVEKINTDRDSLQFAHTFFGQTSEVYQHSTAVSLGRLFEPGNHKDPTVTLRVLLTYIKAHYDKLPRKKFPNNHVDPPVECDILTIVDVDTFLARVAELQPKVGRLMLYRNKIAAHHDEAIALDPSKYLPENQLKFSDAQELHQVAREIVEKCCRAYGVTNAPLEYSTALDIDRLFERLEKLRNIEAETFAKFQSEIAASRAQSIAPNPK